MLARMRLFIIEVVGIIICLASVKRVRTDHVLILQNDFYSTLVKDNFHYLLYSIICSWLQQKYFITIISNIKKNALKKKLILNQILELQVFFQNSKKKNFNVNVVHHLYAFILAISYSNIELLASMTANMCCQEISIKLLFFF